MTETQQPQAAPNKATPTEAQTDAGPSTYSVASDTAKADTAAHDEQEPDEAAPGDRTTGARELWARHRKKLLAGAAGLITAVAGTVITLALPEQKQTPSPYTVAVTYRVTGEGKATITYNTGHPDDPGAREQLVDLPWKKTTRVNPKSGLARVSIVLDENGGKAQCALSVRGQHRQRATAFGNFGRATCAAKVPENGVAKP